MKMVCGHGLHAGYDRLNQRHSHEILILVDDHVFNTADDLEEVIGEKTEESDKAEIRVHAHISGIHLGVAHCRHAFSADYDGEKSEKCDHIDGDVVEIETRVHLAFDVAFLGFSCRLRWRLPSRGLRHIRRISQYWLCDSGWLPLGQAPHLKQGHMESC